MTPTASPSVIAAAEFQPAQRPYILFLAAVDSHRLNAAVTRCAPSDKMSNARLFPCCKSEAASTLLTCYILIMRTLAAAAVMRLVSGRDWVTLE